MTGWPSDEDARRQLARFRTGFGSLRLEAQLAPGRDVRSFSAPEQKTYKARYETACKHLQVSVFVPASGLGTRMFAAYLRALRTPTLDPAVVGQLQQLPKLAIGFALDAYLRAEGLSCKQLLASGDPRKLLSRLLHKPGLGYAEAAKWDLPFHRYGDELRPCWLEHAHEALQYAIGSDSTAYLHATLRPETSTAALSRYRAGFRKLADTRAVRLNFSHSVQDTRTHTLAVYMDDGTPVYTPEGTYLWRPSGHGALLSNLQQVKGTLVFIKNVDNIQTEAHHKAMAHYKKVLGGYALTLRARVHALQRALEPRRPSDEALADAQELLAGTFLVTPPAAATKNPTAERRYLLDRLQRPLRVCGLISTKKTKGGAPFLCRAADGSLSPQLVEPPQVDYTDPQQAACFSQSRYFNPVDMVCVMDDYRGRRYDLAAFVDPETGFITEKTYGGRSIYVQERPGLWNGAMSGWNTAFVEVPADTFAPVKALEDLLAAPHLQAGLRP